MPAPMRSCHWRVSRPAQASPWLMPAASAASFSSGHVEREVQLIGVKPDCGVDVAHEDERAGGPILHGMIPGERAGCQRGSERAGNFAGLLVPCLAVEGSTRKADLPLLESFRLRWIQTPTSTRHGRRPRGARLRRDEAAIQGRSRKRRCAWPGWPGVDAMHRFAMTPAMEWWVFRLSRKDSSPRLIVTARLCSTAARRVSLRPFQCGRSPDVPWLCRARDRWHACLPCAAARGRRRPGAACSLSDGAGLRSGCRP